MNGVHSAFVGTLGNDADLRFTGNGKAGVTSLPVTSLPVTVAGVAAAAYNATPATLRRWLRCESPLLKRPIREVS